MTSDRADIVVIGGSAAGLVAALTARRHHPDRRVLLIRRERQMAPPWSIPYSIGRAEGEAAGDDDEFLRVNGIELLVDEVLALHRDAAELSTRAGRRIGYERVVLATGSRPLLPPLPGADRPGAFMLRRDPEYLRRLHEAVQQADTVVMVGGGYAGMEFAEQIQQMGQVRVTLVEQLAHCLSLSFDEEFCVRAEQLLREQGVDLRTGRYVDRIVGSTRVEQVVLDDGELLPADVVVVSAGAVANVELAREAGLRLGPTSAVLTDSTMRTSDERIFACGDCSEKRSFFGSRPSTMKLLSVAAAEARIAGANLFRTRREGIGVVAALSTSIAGQAFATVGLTEQAARKAGYEVVVGRGQAPDRHPAGIPGARPLEVKLVFDRASRVMLGGQTTGGPVAGTLIHTIGACVQSRMTADQVAIFQLAYHPLLTSSPVSHPFVEAAEAAVAQLVEPPL